MTPADMSALDRLCLGAGAASWSEQEYADFRARPEAILLTFGKGALLAGRVVADEAEVITVAVHPDQRRTGIARHLLALFEEIAHSRGAASLFLEVNEANIAARALYDGAGFLMVGRRRGYYRVSRGETRDALVLRKIVAAASA